MSSDLFGKSFFVRIIANLLTTETFFGLIENIKDIKNLDKNYFLKLFCLSISNHLKNHDFVLIVILSENNLIHAYKNNEKTLYNDRICEGINKLYSSSVSEGDKLGNSFPFSTKNVKLLKRINLEKDIFIDLWHTDFSQNDIMIVANNIKKSYKSILSTTENYINIWNKIKKDEYYLFDEQHKNWNSNYERDRTISIILSLYHFYFKDTDFNNLVCSCFLYRYFPENGKTKSKVDYIIPNYQLEAILELSQDHIQSFNDEFPNNDLNLETVKKAFNSFPVNTFYSPSEIISGQSIYVEEWPIELSYTSKNYPELLNFFESKVIFRQKDYKMYLLPIGELRNQRFSLALRIPMNSKISNELFMLLDELFLIKSNIFKEIVRNDEIREMEDIIKVHPNRKINEIYYHNHDFLDKTSSEHISINQKQKSSFNKWELEQYHILLKNMNISLVKTAFGETNLRTASHNTGSHILAKKLLELQKDINLLRDLDKNNEDIEAEIYIYCFGAKNEIELSKENYKEQEKSSKGEDKWKFQTERLSQKEYYEFVERRIERKEKEINQFHEYLRQRMLYNSDIVTGVPSFDMVFTIGEIKKRFEELSIVKKYISGLDKRVFGEIILKTDDLEDTELAIPNGILGIHALFIIFENFIRNYFKHGGAERKLDLKLKLIKSENTPDHYCICIYPDDGTAIDENSFDIINRFLQAPILDNNNKLRYGGLGLLEMKGAACYLNNISVSEIDNYSITCGGEEKKVLQARKIEDGRLGYYLFLKKPKKILIVSNKLTNTIQLNEKGIYIKSALDYKTNYTHEFLIIHNKHLINNISEHKSSLPTRILLYNDDKLNTDSSSNQFTQINKADFEAVLTAKDDFIYTLLGKWKDYVLKQKYLDKKTLQICRFKNGKLQNDVNKNPIDNYAEIIAYEHKDSKLPERKGLLFYEAYNSEIGTGPIITQMSQYPELKDEIIISAITKIGILEERVQAEVVRLHETQIARNDFDKSNIYIPDNNVFDLNSEDIKKELSQNKAKLKNWLNSVKENLDYLIIHLGFIERFINEKNEEEIDKFINEHISCYLNNDTKIVLTTERGSTGSIPEKYYYLHYSNFSQYIISERSKLHLVKMLYSCRKKSV